MILVTKPLQPSRHWLSPCGSSHSTHSTQPCSVARRSAARAAAARTSRGSFIPPGRGAASAAASAAAPPCASVHPPRVYPGCAARSRPSSPCWLGLGLGLGLELGLGLGLGLGLRFRIRVIGSSPSCGAAAATAWSETARAPRCASRRARYSRPSSELSAWRSGPWYYE